MTVELAFAEIFCDTKRNKRIYIWAMSSSILCQITFSRIAGELLLNPRSEKHMSSTEKKEHRQKISIRFLQSFLLVVSLILGTSSTKLFVCLNSNRAFLIYNMQKCCNTAKRKGAQQLF